MASSKRRAPRGRRSATASISSRTTSAWWSTCTIRSTCTGATRWWTVGRWRLAERSGKGCMKVKLDYGKEGLEVEVPDENLDAILRLNPAPPVPDPRQAVQAALENPI